MRRQAGGGMAGVAFGFAPWIAYWVLAGAGAPRAAVLAGLALAAGLGGWHLGRGRRRPIEWTAAGFFAVHAAVTVGLGSPILARHDALLSSGALAAMAWGSVALGLPFTLVYARESWPRDYWEAPLFRRTNTILSAAWAGIFTVNASLGAASAAWPGSRLLLAAVLPQVTIAAGIACSIVFPRWYPRHRAAREIAARDPFPWAPPAFARPPGPEGAGHDVIVVGAGIGGLTAAALLAARGLRVLVLEQHYLAGGFCTSWPRSVRRGERVLRFVFDAGVHDVSGLGERGPVRHLLRSLGIEDTLAWGRVGHEYVLSGERFRVPERVDDLVRALGDRFPHERTGIEAFFREMAAVYREMYADAHLTGGVPTPPRTVEAMLAYPAGHPHAFRWMHVPFSAMLGAHVRDERLRTLLSMLGGYLSAEPGALSVAAMAPIFGYYFDGGYYPLGGSQTLADALAGVIRSRGGEVRLRTPVERIVVERGQVAGVVADARLERARAVISNADVRRTFVDLVGREHLPPAFARHVEALRPSTSAFVVFLGLDTTFDAAPLTLVAGRRLGIAIPSLVDPSLAPPGHSSMTLTTFVPPLGGQDWERKRPGYARAKRDLGDALIARAEEVFPGLSRHIVYRQEGSPATFARYAWTTGGAIYGPASGPWQPPARSPIEGLVLAGAGTFPGAGVEAVVISGTLAADALYAAARGTTETRGSSRRAA